ncbi:hypothetical protein [Streptomyces phaeoluteigriseus]
MTVYREKARRPVRVDLSMHGARHLGDARALFLFRSEREPYYQHQDVPRQKELLRGAFEGMHPDVDYWLDELDRTPALWTPGRKGR